VKGGHYDRVKHFLFPSTALIPFGSFRVRGDRKLPHYSMLFISMNVTRYTRAGRDGKLIECPCCYQPSRVYHFAWSALTCAHCEESVNKTDWALS